MTYNIHALIDCARIDDLLGRMADPESSKIAKYLSSKGWKVTATLTKDTNTPWTIDLRGHITTEQWRERTAEWATTVRVGEHSITTPTWNCVVCRLSDGMRPQYDGIHRRVALRLVYGTEPVTERDRKLFALGKTATAKAASGRIVMHEADLLKAGVPYPMSRMDVMYDLIMSVNDVAHGEAFEEWAGNVGMDSDSLSAYRIYEQLIERHRWFLRTGQDLGELVTLFKDY